MVYLLLIGALLLNSIANILLKTAASMPTPRVFTFWSLISTYHMAIFGLILFACNAVLYFFALKSLPLSVAYPVMIGGSFLIVSIYAWLYFQEHMTVPLIFGYILIFVGVLLVTVAIK